MTTLSAEQILSMARDNFDTARLVIIAERDYLALVDQLPEDVEELPRVLVVTHA